MPLTARNIYYEFVDLRPPWATSSLPVLLHHGIGTDRGIWSDWMPLLAARHRTVRFDTRGFGCSRAAWSGTVGLNELIADVMGIADAIGEQRFHLIGESLGGTVALAAALSYPERIASVIVSNATHRGTGVTRARNWRKELAGDGMARWADAMMDARFRDDAPMSPAQRAWFAHTQASCDPKAIVDLGELLTGLDLSDEVRRLNRPLLVISPDDSPFIPPAMAAELHSLVPGAQLKIVAASRHGLPFSHAPICAAAALEFLAAHPD